jgi:hypothetical protein
LLVFGDEEAKSRESRMARVITCDDSREEEIEADGAY